MSIKVDPPVRRDGRCAVCRKTRTIPKAQKGVAIENYLKDPFCSSVCARKFHNAPMTSTFASTSS